MTGNLRCPKNLPAKWIFHFRAGRKLADIDVTLVRRKRTGHQALLARDWNCVRNIALPGFRCRSRRRSAHALLIRRRRAWAGCRRRFLSRRLLGSRLSTRVLLRMGDGIPESLQQLAERTRFDWVTRR